MKPENIPLKPKQRSFLSPIYRLAGFMVIIVKRWRSQPALTLLALVSVILAVGLVTNTYFFSQAVDRVTLSQKLEAFSKVTGRPPFSTSAYFYPSRQKPVSLPEAESLGKQVADILVEKVGLPLRHQGLQVSSGGLLLMPEADSTKYSTAATGFLDTIEVTYIAGVADYIQVTSGEPFTNDGESGGDVLDVWIPEAFAQKLGADLNEKFTIGATVSDQQVTIRLAGFWQSTGFDSQFWFSNPDIQLKSAFLVHRADYIKFIQPSLPSLTRETNWYIILDESKVKPSNSAKYLDGFSQASALINRILPGARLNTPPLDPLNTFVQTSNTLTILLLSYNIPAFFILLYFLIISASIIARWQRRDMSLLVSRGMSVSGVLNQVLLEQLMLFVVGYPLGIGFGMLVAWIMGYSTSFLEFAFGPNSGRAALPVSIQDVSIPLTFVALALSLLARLWPAVEVARSSKNIEERQWVRPMQQPFWNRFYLDFLLILPTWYAYDQMVKNGSLSNIIPNNIVSSVYQDPLLILVPALFIVTASLLLMRLFSIVMRLIDIPASLTPWLTIHLALRQLSRQSQDYLRPLMIVVVTLALGVYTLSMSASLDQWLIDRKSYQSGADLTFRPMPMFTEEEPTDADWAPPIDEYRKLPGVVGATRVGYFFVDLNTELIAQSNAAAGRVPGRYQAPQEDFRIQLLALDRDTFPSVAWFRSDFSQEPLVAMMNRLASTSDGVLVPRDILTNFELQIGDQIPVTVGTSFSQSTSTQLTIVGSYDYFPTMYTEQGVMLIGNLENLSNLFGFTLNHEIWLKLAPETSGETVLEEVTNNLEIKTRLIQDTRKNILEEQTKSERVGIFGTLTIGFLATALMATLGLLIYSYASLQNRVYHLAMQLAIGVSRRQVVAQVVLEYTFLALFGVVAGAVIGITACNLFVPFFRFTGERGVIPLPPLLPIINWPGIQTLTIIFTAVIVIAEVITVALSIRDRIGQLLKGV